MQKQNAFKKNKTEIQKSIRLLSEKINSSLSYEELLKFCDEFKNLFLEIANEKNIKKSKSIGGWKNYFKKASVPKRSLEAVIKKATKPKLRARNQLYLDYLQEIKNFRSLGMSYPKISEEMKNRYKIKVSAQTISKIFKKGVKNGNR